MKFIRDLLFFELVTTGIDPDKDNIIQLSAKLLDRDNLLEKASFNSFIRVSYLESIIFEHSKFLRIPSETLKKSPKIYDAIKLFRNKFGNQVLLATHGLANVLFLKNGFKKAAMPFDYNPHVLDLWTLGYIYTLNYGIKKMPTLDTFLDYFKLKVKNPFDSMEKLRLEMEVFKKIIREA